MRRPLHDIATATAVAAVLSGAPSTTHALLTGRSPLAAARAAGTLWPGRRDRPGLVAGGAAHAAVSAGWGTVLGVALPRHHTVAWGALAGLGIAAFDLVVVGGRHVPAIAALPQVWQWADHVAFGATVGWVLSRTDAAPA
ncbi:MAG TPA: hypothetical protein VGJ03_16545 [Acidimicrobiales bacterium]|jgi:hypothetical protein